MTISCGLHTGEKKDEGDEEDELRHSPATAALVGCHDEPRQTSDQEQEIHLI